MSFKLLKSLGLLSLITIVAALLSCGSDDQFTNKLVAQPFVSKLFGQTTKTIALSTNEGDQIAWMGLEWSGDYKLFQIDRVNTHVPKAIHPTTVVENISVSSSPFNNSDGIKINGPLQVTLTYKPNRAISSEDQPHKAYLLIAYDKPNLGVVRVELLGYTRGIRITKCTRPPSIMEPFTYKPVDSKFKLYVCDSQAVTGADINDPEGRASTNIAEITVESNFVFYKLDKETVCFLDDKPNNALPSIPDFIIPVPPSSGAPIDELEVTAKENSAGECSLNNDGNLFCDQRIELDVFGGVVPVKPLTITNGKTTPVATDCSSFEELSGEGLFGDEKLTLIAWGEVEGNNQTKEFKVDGALVVAIIELELQ